MSIVLIIIGLIVGVVLVGNDLIKSAQIRSQISQIEEFQTAVNTFKLKYNAIPGDISLSKAAFFGLSSAYSCDGGDSGARSNGMIDGCFNKTAIDGESNLFWRQLGDARLVNGNFQHLKVFNPDWTYAPSVVGEMVARYLPKAKIGGNSSYIYVWGYGPSYLYPNKKNYFALTKMASLLFGTGSPAAAASITPMQSYVIDSKIDDGLPQSGTIIAAATFGAWPGGAWIGASTWTYNLPTTQAVAGNSSTCYDNKNVNGEPQQYSILQNGGNNITCVISVEFNTN
jgi:hypothetical protein